MATLSGAFECGSFDPAASFVDAAVEHVYLRARRTWAGLWWWYAVRLDGALGKAPRVHLLQADSFNATSPGTVSYGWWGTSMDHPSTWHRFDHQTEAGDYIDLWNDAAFASDTIYLACAPPYTVSRVAARVAAWSASPYVSAPASAPGFQYSTIPSRTMWNGLATGVLPCYALRITDPAVAGPKKRAVFVAGTHPGEVTGGHLLEGIVDFLLSSDPRAVRLRRAWVITVYPCIDPQGRWAGNYRSAPINSGSDNNRVWNTADVEAINKVKAVLQAEHGGEGLHLFVDFHSWLTYNGDVASRNGMFSHGSFREAPSFRTRMQALEPTYAEIPFDTGVDTMTSVQWARANLDAAGLLRIAQHSESGSALSYGLADWRATGARQMHVVDDMEQQGIFGAAYAAPAGAAQYEGQYTADGGATWHAWFPWSAQADLKETLSTAALPSGTTVGGRVRSRDASDGSSPSGWAQGFSTVQHAAAPPNQPPVADFTFALNGLLVTFTDLSYDPDGPSLVWGEWNFGDGSPPNSATHPSHQYEPRVASYAVTRSVRDSTGATHSTTKAVSVTAAPPPAAPDPRASMRVNGQDLRAAFGLYVNDGVDEFFSSAAVRRETASVAGLPGEEDTGPDAWEPRVLRPEGDLVAETREALDDARDRLFFALYSRTLEVSAGVRTDRVYVARVQGEVRVAAVRPVFSQRAQGLTISLLCNDPFAYSTDETVVDFRGAGGAQMPLGNAPVWPALILAGVVDPEIISYDVFGSERARLRISGTITNANPVVLSLRDMTLVDSYGAVPDLVLSGPNIFLSPGHGTNLAGPYPRLACTGNPAQAEARYRRAWLSL